MKKKLILSAVIFLSVSIFALGVLISEKINNNQTNGEPPVPQENNQIADGRTILFYGDGCPHCLEVESFLEQNSVSAKIQYESKEVWGNEENRGLMLEKVQACKIDAKTVGVPFLWDGINGKCLIGKDQVIDFFQKRLGAVKTINIE
jgi:hypothetical protein